MILDRRDLILAGTAVAVTGCAKATPPPAPVPSPAPGPVISSGSVDVHCHVFNAHDVPVRKFVELAYLETKIPGGTLLDPLLAFVCFIMNADAPTTEKELAELRGGERMLVQRDTLRRKIDLVGRAIQQMRKGKTQFDYRPPGMPAEREAVQSARVNPANQVWIQRRFPLAQRRRLARVPPDARVHAELDRAARFLISWAALGTWIDFAFNYTKSRYELTEQLANLSPMQASEVVLYTPALLDIGHWVGDLHTSDIGQQVEIMELIAARPGRKYAVHAFVPFDPWRAIGDPSVLQTVIDAINSQGCIGVKVYPPMGFKPMNNDVANFPDERRPSHPDGAAAVNQTMGALLEYCLQNDVPVMAHCSDSQFVTDLGGACANPQNWKDFMDLSPRNRLLRLNLAHFGGPWDLDIHWSDTVTAMLGQYPNLYSDIADASFVLDDPSKAANNKRVLDRMKALLNPASGPKPAARSRVMYGSDWSLLAREPHFTPYYAKMKTEFCDAVEFTVDECRGFLGLTALRFLGLAKAADGTMPLARQRLVACRRQKNLGMALFDTIDALTA